ncbi:uncharacterized protein C2845_PM12G15370 [Panicum miliaceum]|uniref:Myb-like domain-containing protein n=1 Tax=Panicum miliaceum TaxID=4540 RepID=A0A3L6QE09_PANMI|nr:uncharacterized protein C2845_PM12G15370 [Panicum miliaceum]
MPAPSAAAERLAAQWVADALAADETIDFSVIKALVGDSSEFFVGAPDAARERVALRCLQELAAFAVSDEDGVAAAAAPSGTLRVDAARSCEDLLIELTGQVGSSISFEKDRILPFRQDIQDFICIKKPTLPGTSLELLREVDPEIQSVVAPSPVDQNGIKKHDNNQSLCNVNRLHSNVEKPRPPTVSTELQPENVTHVVNETEIGNFQQCPIKPTVDFDQPCASDLRFYNQPQEDAINAASVGASTTEKNLSNVDSDLSVAAVPVSASCNATSQGNIVEPLSKKDMVDKTAVVQPQPCKGKSSNPNDDGTCDQSLKDPSHENQTVQATMAPAFDRTNDVLPTDTSEASHMVNQNLDGSASIPPVEKDPVHEELTLRAASGIPSVPCNGAMQEDKSGTNHPSTEHSTMFEEQIGTKSQLEVSCADKNKHTLYDDGTMLEKNTVCGGLNVQTAPESRSCNVTLHDKISEANSLSEQNIETNTTEVQKRSCSISVPNSSHDGDRKRAKQYSKKKTVGKTVAETSHVHNADDSFSGFAAARLLSMTGKMPLCSQVQEANDCLGVSQEQDLCIKCGKDGQLLQCSSCLLSAHDSCFGSSVTFEDSGQFYCPVCICTKATEAYQKAKKTYIEARKNLVAFLGTEQLLKHHDEQQTNGEDQLNVRNSSKKQKGCSQTKDDDLAHQGEESDRQRKKQKINATSDACNGVVIEKASSVRNADVAPMNKHSVLQNYSNQPHNSEKDHHVENTEAREDAGNGHSSHERRNSSQNRCTPAANPEVEADKEDVPTNSHQSEDSDEIEASSSNDSGKRSAPPWRTMKHHKAKPQEREATAASNSRKAFGQQDQHMPSPSGKRKYAYPPKRYPFIMKNQTFEIAPFYGFCFIPNNRAFPSGSSNPVAPTGRRSKLCWTEEEEAALREAMEKFTPRGNGAIPWVQILEHGRNVFHKTRLPCDLRVKWRNMKKKAGS